LVFGEASARVSTYVAFVGAGVDEFSLGHVRVPPLIGS
jgi:hypothetical protein